LATTLLLYEPDNPEDSRIYADAIRRSFPAVQVLTADHIADAVAKARGATALAAKAQDVSAELVAAMPKLAWIQALTTGIDPLHALDLPKATIVTSVRGIHGP
jgi:phosphoglycerate dehydrogenase-like enzyme